MGETTIDRRRLVRGATAVAAGTVLVGAAATPASATDGGHGSLVGGWWVTHRDDPPADPNEGISVVTFAPGGTFVSNDIRPAGGVNNGVWSATGKRFRATFWGTVPLGPPGEPGGSIEVRVRGRLGRSHISGTYSLTIFDPDGAELDHGTGTFEGTRLTA